MISRPSENCPRNVATLASSSGPANDTVEMDPAVAAISITGHPGTSHNVASIHVLHRHQGQSWHYRLLRSYQCSLRFPHPAAKLPVSARPESSEARSTSACDWRCPLSALRIREEKWCHCAQRCDARVRNADWELHLSRDETKLEGVVLKYCQPFALLHNLSC